jgi:flagellar export protein FliJ
MKQFSFRLDRVLEWRRTQVRIEEAKLEQLNGELRAIAAQQTAIREETEQTRVDLACSSAVTGVELAALEHYRQAASQKFVRLQQSRAQCNQKIAGQMQQVTERRREARLLEKLRERRVAEWSTALARDIEQQAEESFLSRWNATQ